MTLAFALARLLGVDVALVAAIAQAATAAALAHNVSPCDVMAVGVLESRAGLDRRAASPFGVRLNHRYIASVTESADVYARSLSRAVARCGTRGLAFAALRGNGGCRDVTHRAYVTRALGVSARLCAAGDGR